jgi:hypothetical protein
VSMRDELLMRLASGAAEAEGMGTGPAVTGAEGMSGTANDSGGAGAEGIRAGVEVTMIGGA